MPITLSSCPYCGSADHHRALNVAAPEHDTYANLIAVTFQSPVHYLTCKTCGLTFRNQIFSATEAEQLYACAYRQHILKSMSGDAYFDHVIGIPAAESELDAKIVNLKRLLGKLCIKTAIDIGCGVGAFLYKLRAALPDIVAEGVEPTTDFAEVAARRNDTKVFNKNYDGFSLKAFDLITCVHVLEHTPKPWDFLRSISQNMRSGTHLYLETPSVEDMRVLPAEHDRFMSPHNYLFSREFIYSELGKTGLRPLCVDYAPTQRGKIDLRAFAIKV